MERKSARKDANLLVVHSRLLEDDMKLKTVYQFGLLITLSLIPTLGFSIELDQYKHVAKGVTGSIGRGITLFNKELESARTE